MYFLYIGHLKIKFVYKQVKFMTQGKRKTKFKYNTVGKMKVKK